MTVLCAAVFGSCLGFLWYNAHPAQVFMGDTGSLPLGGLLGFIAVVTRMELLLLLAGGVFVMETVSVILQVSYFKLTKPKGGMQATVPHRADPPPLPPRRLGRNESGRPLLAARRDLRGAGAGDAETAIGRHGCLRPAPIDG